jgi:hypothetical protein
MSSNSTTTIIVDFQLSKSISDVLNAISLNFIIYYHSLLLSLVLLDSLVMFSLIFILNFVQIFVAFIHFVVRSLLLSIDLLVHQNGIIHDWYCYCYKLSFFNLWSYSLWSSIGILVYIRTSDYHKYIVYHFDWVDVTNSDVDICFGYLSKCSSESSIDSFWNEELYFDIGRNKWNKSTSTSNSIHYHDICTGFLNRFLLITMDYYVYVFHELLLMMWKLMINGRLFSLFILLAIIVII